MERNDNSFVCASSCRIFFLAFAENCIEMTILFNVEMNIARRVKDLLVLF